jgi:hypothetical protein
MSPVAEFLVVLVSLAGSTGGTIALVYNADRIIVAVLRRTGLPVYPLAVSIAVLIFEHPEQWSGTEHTMSHPKVGSIWISNGVSFTRIKSEFGEWKPNWIERRIIRDAVDWRIRGYIRNRITEAMRLPAP